MNNQNILLDRDKGETRIRTSDHLFEATGVNYISDLVTMFYAPDQLRSYMAIRPHLSVDEIEQCRPIVKTLVDTIKSFTPGVEKDAAMKVVELL